MFFLFYFVLFLISQNSFSSQNEWNVCDDNFRIVTHIANNQQYYSKSSLESRRTTGTNREYRIPISEDVIKKNTSGVTFSVTEESITIESEESDKKNIYYLPTYKKTNQSENDRYIDLMQFKEVVKTVENYHHFNPHFDFEHKLQIDGKIFQKFAQIPKTRAGNDVNNFILEPKHIYDAIKPHSTTENQLSLDDKLIISKENDTTKISEAGRKKSNLKKIVIPTLLLACVGITASIGASSYFLYRKLVKKKS